MLYLIIAAGMFMAAVNHRKPLVFGLVLLAALLSTAGTFLSLKRYLAWNEANSDCATKAVVIANDRTAESQLKKFAQGTTQDNDWWRVSTHTDGRSLIYETHFKKPVDPTTFSGALAIIQKTALKVECDEQSGNLKRLKAIQTHTFYGVDGQRLASFAVTPADCPQQ